VDGIETKLKMPNSNSTSNPDKQQESTVDSQLVQAPIDAREERRIENIRSYATGRDSINGNAPGFQQIPIAWKWCTCSSAEFRERIGKKCQAFARTYDGKASAILLGSTGKGKTSGVLAALRRLRDEAERETIARTGALPERHPTLQKLHGLQWFSGSEIALARKRHALGSGEAKLISDAIYAPLLVIDEVGFEPLDGALFDVIDARYNKERPTILTSGLTSKAFAEKYGDALWRRLTERGIVVEDFS
jgi:DNA replication protein DnaC